MTAVSVLASSVAVLEAAVLARLMKVAISGKKMLYGGGVKREIIGRAPWIASVTSSRILMNWLACALVQPDSRESTPITGNTPIPIITSRLDSFVVILLCNRELSSIPAAIIAAFFQ